MSAPLATSRQDTPKSGSNNVITGSLYQQTLTIPERLLSLISDRVRAEEELGTRNTAKLRRAEETRKQASVAAEERRGRELADLEAYLESTRSAAASEFTGGHSKIEAERQTLRRNAESRYRRTKEELVSTFEASRWEAGTIFETTERGANEWRAEKQSKLKELSEELEELKESTLRVLTNFQLFSIGNSVAERSLKLELQETDDPIPLLQERIDTGFQLHDELDKLRLPRSFQGVRIITLFVIPVLILAYPAYVALGPLIGGITALVASIAIGSVLTYWVVRTARKQVARLRDPLQAAIVRADSLVALSAPYLKSTYDAMIASTTGRRDEDFLRAEKLRNETDALARSAREEKIKDAEGVALQQHAKIVVVRDKILQDARETEGSRRQSIAQQFDEDERVASAALVETRQLAHAQRESDQKRLSERWTEGLKEIRSEVDRIQAAIDFQFADLQDGPTPSWSTPSTLPLAIPLGRLTIPLHELPGGLPADPLLRDQTPRDIPLPAILDFPERASVVFEAGSEETRRLAIEAMQSVMLRYLTGLPAGKVRFTIVDPVGLGRNFAAFMHLADFSEAMVNGRIWTEPQQIDQRLAELNLHIETVIQNYLRNEFATIEQYNEQAAEVAEPYRVLVVADFPAGFSEASARRLVAIAKSGPRCGVYLVLGLDTSQPFPPGINRAELASRALRVYWKDQRPVLRQPEFEPYPLQLDVPPHDEVMTRWLHRVGEAAHAANRVEVPFEVIAPRREDYWKSQSASSVAIPLGRSGATKLQPLALGKGTSQHVLIAGRTGSGKSTLLHALITNAALMYHPDQLEMYLIDFKKGVEFKTYATHKLPHARVVAIESEREFGLSVLQRLDQELRSRGDRFRDLGVQDLAGFRAMKPDEPLPRTLFIVDEFQEFFVEDDKLAQEASLLLDRLVRQGRAFGIHVILGSQTLSGAYSLARSTLGQMAVRIALQCSEADAQLILNEDNAAARLLSRPGEAIYNDANGQTEGNHVFQVVWLPDARREAYLKTLSEMTREQRVATRPTIVFEGNVPSNITGNPSFLSLAPRLGGVPQASLGEAVAIKEPTAAAFRSQGGSNLLVIGQNEEMAVGLFLASILGLAAETGNASRFYVLDGTPEDSPFAGRLATLASVVPQDMKLGGTRETGWVLSEVLAEVESRQSSGGDSAPWFVIIHDLSRFRDLRKGDDDFSFGRRGEEKVVSPAKQLSSILRDGPPLGVHVLIWCDSLNNANRSFDRQAMREFEMRILFQMSPADSSNLIDSPVANRLGANRALFASEEQGKLEKFRPYGLPSTEWLTELGRRWKAERSIADPASDA